MVSLVGCKTKTTQETESVPLIETETTVSTEETIDPFMEFVPIDDLLETQSTENTQQETVPEETANTTPTETTSTTPTETTGTTSEETTSSPTEETESESIVQMPSYIENMGDLIP